MLCDRRGISSLEYSVLVVLVVLLCIGAWRGLGQTVVCTLAGANAEYARQLGVEGVLSSTLQQCPSNPRSTVAGGPSGARNTAATPITNVSSGLIAVGTGTEGSASIPGASAPGSVASAATNPAAAATPPAPTAPAQPLPALQPGATGLGPAVDELIAGSPTAAANLATAQANGITIQWGPVGGGSWFGTEKGTNKRVITLEASLSPESCPVSTLNPLDDPAFQACAQAKNDEAFLVLSHELGHATYTQGHSNSQVESTFVDDNTTFALMNEGHAELARVQAQTEYMAAHPGRTFAARTPNEAQYQDIYRRLNGPLNPGETPITRDQADRLAAEVFRHGESPSNSLGSKDYDEYYRNFYQAEWDTAEAAAEAERMNNIPREAW